MWRFSTLSKVFILSLHVEHVAQSVPKQVETESGVENCKSGREDFPPHFGQELAAIGNHRPKVRCRWFHPKPEERQRSAKQNDKSCVQGGFDGTNPAIENKKGTDIVSTNTQGFDLSSASASGSVAYKRAINAVSNPDEYDINLLAIPGVIHQLHSSVTNHAIDKIEDRADAFFIMDGSHYSASIQTAINDIQTLDSNYVATYYPWVKVIDEVKNKPTWVPPSVVLPGVYSNNDRIILIDKIYIL